MSVPYYHDLLADKNRVHAFQRSIRASVQPGDVVLEIGTGLGTFSLFAAQAGARKVYAVDGDPVIHVAQALAVANDQADHVECIRGWVPEVNLPTLADVLIFEDFGAALLDTHTYRMLRDSTAKYLRPGGRMVPGRATVYVSPLSSAALRERLFPMDSHSDGYGIDWGPSQEYLKNTPRQDRLPEDVVAADPKPLYSVDFPTLPDPSEIAGAFTWRVKSGTPVHALGLWFDLDLQKGGRVTNRPAEATGPWGQVVLPLDPPLVVDESGEFHAQIGNDPTADGAPGWLRWAAQAGGNTARGHEFASAPADLSDLIDSGEDARAHAPVGKHPPRAPDTGDTPVALTG